jgi:PhzF family phenazine biosynthesis protein
MRRMDYLHLVDAFAERPFTGNPAAVCLLGAARSDSWMQQVAFELGYSETAFVLRGEAGFGLRWFTPKAEVDLCGHATLASAHVLWNAGSAEGTISFHTRSGELRCERDGRMIAMDFPRTELRDVPPPVGLLSSLGFTPLALKQAGPDFLFEVQDEESVRRASPDLRALAEIPLRGVIVTARSRDPAFDFVSRFFAPAVGVDEDPVTGSAHCALAPYWTERVGKRVMRARQLSQRGGQLDLELTQGRVRLAGQAVTILTGALTV